MLLQLIVTLTEQSAGCPPTLAEIALALGLQSSSRANVQRQLSRLRPTYIDWTNSPRSLRVTPAGQAILDLAHTAPADGLPLPDIILPLLSSGLTQMADSIEQGRPLQVPYPNAWQRGLNILAVECLMRGVDPPAHTIEALAWCHRPVSTWPVRFSAPGRQLEATLLEAEQPTDLCRELARGCDAGDAELELCEQLMGQVRREAELRRAQTSYVAVRRYPIEHPVVTQEELLHASFDPEVVTFGAELNEMYEAVPDEALTGGEVLLCGHCGWTLVRRQGRLRCGDDRCRLLTANFTEGTEMRPVDREMPLLRVRRAIRRYVVSPGRYELETARRIRSLGVSVDLWPNFDAYDLRVSFGKDEAWAVDVKDWRFPHLLARQLAPLPAPRGSEWNRAIYAIPDDRIRENPGYLGFLRNATAQQPFDVLAISELLAAIRERKQVLDGKS